MFAVISTLPHRHNTHSHTECQEAAERELAMVPSCVMPYGPQMLHVNINLRSDERDMGHRNEA